MFAALKKHWALSLTVLVLVAAAVVYVAVPDMNTLSQLGGYLSGFASAIAFIWLIAVYIQQGSELQLQRQELSLQRNALDLQREELKKMGKYASMEQVEHIIETIIFL